MIARVFFSRTRPPYKSASPGPVIIKTSAALTSIQALSAEDCAAFTSLSSCASFSLTALETSGVARKATVMAGVAEGAGACCAERGRAPSRMAPITRTKLKLHFHPTHFIDMSAPLALDSTAGDPPLSTPCIIRKRALRHSLKFSFPRFVFLMHRFPLLSANSACKLANGLLVPTYFVQPTLQRIMPCGMANG